MAEVNEIFNSDEAKKIIDVGNAISKADDALLKLIKDSEKLIQILQQQNISFEQLNNVQKQAAKTTQDIDNVGKQLIQSEKKIKELEDDRIVTLQRNRLEIQKRTQEIKEQIKIDNSQENSTKRLRLENKRLREELDSLDLTRKSNRETIDRINSEINKNNKLIEKNSDEQRKAKFNVGRYTESILEAIKRQREIDKELNKTKKEFNELPDTIKKTDEAITKYKNSIDSLTFEFNELSKISNVGFDQIRNDTKKYGEELGDAIKDQEIFGLSINKITGFLSSGAGVFAAITATVVGLGKAYASSARGAEDMARASDRLNSIAKSLGNTLADATGESNLFDTVVRGLQQQLLGLANTIDSDVQVAILSAIRQLQILESDQERQKKSQLDRAEQLRQIRDEERKSFKERKEANDELGRVITEREAETIAFQEKKLKNYQTLLKFDEGNIEIQQAIKQIEFEIADAREEAQGFRSEQLANDLALSKEYYANQIELSNLAIEAEIKRNGESLELTKKLIANRLKLELEAAGENEQLIAIANKRAENERLQAEINANKAIEEERTKHNEEIRKIDQKIIEDESKRRSEEAIERETEFNELKSNLDIEALEKWKEINLERAASDQAYIDSVLSLEEQKRMAKMETLDIVRSVFGEETAIGKIATAIQRVEAIKQNLISLGVITAKQAEGVAKSAAAAPFPFNLPLIAGTVAQFVSIFSLFKKSKVQGFWKGTENAPGKFIAGERGRELMMLKTGELMMVDKPTYFEGNKYKGATIKSNPETEKIISKAQNSNNFVFDTADLKNEMKLVRLAIEKKSVSIIDKRGSIIGKQSGNYREIYLNKLKNGR